MKQLKPKLNTLLAELETLAQWFENTKNMDIDEALKRAEHATELITTIKQELKTRENKFHEISKKLEQ